jgi:hypothetical protein
LPKLPLVAVRAEQVQEISEEDAIAEGIEAPDSPGHEWVAARLFSRLWDSINAKRGHGWDANPWTWPLTYQWKGK